MAIIKCKMCGGDLNVQEGMSVAECEYCGTKQTVPSADSEKKMTLFARANRLRFACEFDKAAGIYEALVAEFPEEAEAYWGLVLCKYGIEYVDDPATGRKIPTCHRSSFDSVMDDPNFEQAQENADVVARKVYREEAKAIEELRKGIIEVSGKEEPYDIFICYKETAENGDRTLDSVLAQDIYDALTEKGYRVFFSRITLEDKLGQEYEPYIFAALNSAKIMLAVGTDYEYYNAVWVKNEWSRYLQLMVKDKEKHLIPCYKNIDAYDMPKEFAKLQAQDLGKVGAVQDLLRGIEKMLGKKGQEQSAKETVVVQQSGGPNVESLLKRGNMALEDGDWNKAKEYFDQVLNMNAECGEAYLGLAMADEECKTREAFFTLYEQKDLSGNRNIQRATQFGDRTLREYFEKVEVDKKRTAEESKRRLASIREKLKKVSHLLAAGNAHTVGVKVDGTVVAVGSNTGWQDRYLGQCDVSGWRDIAAIAASGCRTIGLKTDGTVVTTDKDADGQSDVSLWKNIVSVAMSGMHTVGLIADGSLVTSGDARYGQRMVFDWRDIVAVAADVFHTVGLKADGTVVVTDSLLIGCHYQNVSDWKNIVAIATGGTHVIGLQSDGTVVADGYNKSGQCNVSGWNDIVAIAAGLEYSVGLKIDGTVVAIGCNDHGQCNVSGWRNIVAIAADGYHTVGLRSDGTVVATGSNDHGQCNVSRWRLFNNIDTIEEERKQEQERMAKRLEKERLEREAEQKEAERRRQEERQKMLERLPKEQAALKEELSKLKGLFSGKRRREIEARLAEIERILKGLRF